MLQVLIFSPLRAKEWFMWRAFSIVLLITPLVLFFRPLPEQGWLPWAAFSLVLLICLAYTYVALLEAKSAGRGIPLERKDLIPNMRYQVANDEGGQFWVFLKDEQGEVKAYMLREKPPTVFKYESRLRIHQIDDLVPVTLENDLKDKVKPA
jgi:hypothetical protein